jgi:hypothetical protein
MISQMRPNQLNDMKDQDNFPSGSWVGFYTHARQNKKHRLDLGLTFAEGRVTGCGNDDVGQFLLRGKYDTKTMECHWTKNYLGMHDVFYRGFREGKGIYGKWEIKTKNHGGFNIWPLGREEAGKTEPKSQEQPKAQAVAGPVAGSNPNGLQSQDDIPSLERLAGDLVANNQILQATDTIIRGLKCPFPYRPFYVLLARMMRFCSCDQVTQVTFLLDEFGANLPDFLKRHMRWKEVAMYMRFHDISGIKKCLVILENQVPGTSSTERGSA